MYDNTKDNEYQERAVLAGLSLPDGGGGRNGNPDSSDDASLDELEALLETAGGACVARVLQNRDAPDARTFLGAGKVKEVAELCALHGVDLVVFDNELSPAQTRCLEEDLGVRVIDRSLLILDIFAERALTREGRLQVEMAQLKYILPRLAGLGLSLSRQGGGIGTRRGPGETKLETDRRHIRRRVEKLAGELQDVRRVRALQRDRRQKNETPVVSLIGYTNSGKSTLFNALSGAGIPARGRLFDTLDTTARRVELPDGVNILLTDTVGFIRKLPHHLVEAFRATLEELRYADALLHVIDAANPAWEEQAAVVDELADRLGASGAPRLRVYNKCDLTDIPPPNSGGPPQESDSKPPDSCGVVISALDGTGLDALREKIAAVLDTGARRVTLLLPYGQAAALDLLHREARVESEAYTGDGVAVQAVCDRRLLGRMRDYIVT